MVKNAYIDFLFLTCNTKSMENKNQSLGSHPGHYAVISLILALIIFMLGIMVFANPLYQPINQSYTSATIKNPVPASLQQLPTPIPSNGKQYKNSLYGFSFLYPSDLTLQEVPSGTVPNKEYPIVAIDKPTALNYPQISIFITTTDMTPTDWINTHLCKTGTDGSTQCLSQTPGPIPQSIQVSTTQSAQYQGTNLYVSHNGMLYDIAITATAPNTPIQSFAIEAYNQVVSTFTFGTESSDTTSWKTYTNNGYWYQLLYPSNWVVSGANSQESLNYTGSANFKDVNDQTSSLSSGFTITQVDDPKALTLSDWLSENPNNGTILPRVKSLGGITVTSFSVNGYTWSKVTNDSVGYVPSGFIRYATVHNNKLFYIVDYGKNQELLDTIVKNFVFIN